mmetsp:Transcript_28904/g.69059  ORF Transcript_28904/g.69059 Transcript_28904/m.69059 type:complete len:292 (+) Transcript_28904:1079-1954(+)
MDVMHLKGLPTNDASTRRAAVNKQGHMTVCEGHFSVEFLYPHHPRRRGEARTPRLEKVHPGIPRHPAFPEGGRPANLASKGERPLLRAFAVAAQDGRDPAIRHYRRLHQEQVLRWEVAEEEARLVCHKNISRAELSQNELQRRKGRGPRAAPVGCLSASRRLLLLPERGTMSSRGARLRGALGGGPVRLHRGVPGIFIGYLLDAQIPLLELLEPVAAEVEDLWVGRKTVDGLGNFLCLILDDSICQRLIVLSMVTPSRKRLIECISRACSLSCPGICVVIAVGMGLLETVF